ncbi:unnamed protein product, partial [Pelagomonas calceolata]
RGLRRRRSFPRRRRRRQNELGSRLLRSRPPSPNCGCTHSKLRCSCSFPRRRRRGHARGQTTSPCATGNGARLSAALQSVLRDQLREGLAHVAPARPVARSKMNHVRPHARAWRPRPPKRLCTRRKASRRNTARRAGPTVRRHIVYRLLGSGSTRIRRRRVSSYSLSSSGPHTREPGRSPWPLAARPRKLDERSWRRSGELEAFTQSRKNSGNAAHAAKNLG